MPAQQDSETNLNERIRDLTIHYNILGSYYKGADGEKAEAWYLKAEGLKKQLYEGQPNP